MLCLLSGVAVADGGGGVAFCPIEVGGASPYDADRIHATIAALADPALGGRVPGTKGGEAARLIISTDLLCGGVTDTREVGTDVVGVVPGTDPNADLVIVGAHYDHLGRTKAGLLLGANDNASGVAGLLAIARDVAAHPGARTVVFVAFDREEEGELGAQDFVDHSPWPTGKMAYMVNLDMIGSYRGNGLAVFGATPGSPARTALDRLMRSHKRLAASLGGVSDRSDNAPFCKEGIPYAFFWTPDRACYHAACDTVARVDSRDAAEIAQVAGELVRDLANTDTDLHAYKLAHPCRR
ncbi:MAG TPA: M28 family peptidase [Kofleriaceae bacterium]